MSPPSSFDASSAPIRNSLALNLETPSGTVSATLRSPSLRLDGREVILSGKLRFGGAALSPPSGDITLQVIDPFLLLRGTEAVREHLSEDFPEDVPILTTLTRVQKCDACGESSESFYCSMCGSQLRVVARRGRRCGHRAEGELSITPYCSSCGSPTRSSTGSNLRFRRLR